MTARNLSLLPRLLTLLCWLAAAGGQAQGLHFVQDTVALGPIAEDDEPRTYRFRYRNEGRESVTLTRAVTTCSCAAPHFSSSPIRPQEEGEVAVTFYPLGRVGKTVKEITLYTESSGAQPAYRLYLAGEVLPPADPYLHYPYQIGPLRLMQGDVHFGTVRGQRRQMVRIEVVHTGDRPLQLSAANLPDYLSFATEPELIGPQETADLLFVLEPGKIGRPGAFEGTFSLEGLEGVPPQQRVMHVNGVAEPER